MVIRSVIRRAIRRVIRRVIRRAIRIDKELHVTGHMMMTFLKKKR